jgi:hypothetical protein
MNLSQDEKTLLGLYRKIEGKKSRADLILQGQLIVQAQEALKADYGLLGPDATLFNGKNGKPAA